MAGWLPMKVTLAESEEVDIISSATGLDKFAVVGRLQYLWSWVFQHTTDGSTKLDRSAVDRKVDFAGFADAMVKADWLVVTDAGVVFKNWAKNNTTDAALKEGWAVRQRRRRDRLTDVPPESRESHTDVTRDKPDKTNTNTKTNTRESSQAVNPNAQATLPNCDAGASPVRAIARTRDGSRPFSQRTLKVWEACGWRRVGRRAALLKIEQAGMILASERFKGDKDAACAFLAERAQAFTDSPLAQSTPKQFLPHPATWFHEGRYDDDPSEWARSRENDGGEGPTLEIA